MTSLRSKGGTGRDPLALELGRVVASVVVDMARQMAVLTHVLEAIEILAGCWVFIVTVPIWSRLFTAPMDFFERLGRKWFGP